MYKKNIGLQLSTIIVVCLLSLQTFAQSWNIPADKKAKNSYIQFTPSTAREGEDLYNKNCMSCHGNPGKGNSMKALNPVPPDLGGTVTQQRTDGDLFYIITTGRAIMPSFKDIFSEEARWNLISYIRSFNKQYVQVLSRFNPLKAKLVKFNLVYIPLTHMIRVAVVANETTGKVVLKNDVVALYAKRYFGRLQLDKVMNTNEDGIAFFNFPTDLPGDKSGNVILIAKVSDDIYGEAEYQQKFKIGIPTDKPPLTQKRAIWNVVEKAPVWLLATYTTGILVVGLFLLYILSMLRKLKKSGTINT